MNKTELVSAIAEAAGINKDQAGTALDTVVSSITETLAKGESVTLIGFGSFVVRERAARTGRNPRTGEPLEIKAANVPSFKPGKALKEALN